MKGRMTIVAAALLALFLAAPSFAGEEGKADGEKACPQKKECRRAKDAESCKKAAEHRELVKELMQLKKKDPAKYQARLAELKKTDPKLAEKLARLGEGKAKDGGGKAKGDAKGK